MRKLSFAILIIAVAYCALGIYRLGFNQHIPYACDLYLRWAENRSIITGQSPFNPLQDSRDYQAHFTGVTRDWLDSRASERTAVYPPWSYSLSMLFVVPTHWSISRTWFTCCSILSLTAIVWSFYFSMHHHGSPNLDTDLKAIASLANISFLYCLSNGQYGILVTALLLLSLISWENDQKILAGIFLGLSTIKPQLSILFFLVPLILRDWRVLLSSLLIVIFGTTATCLIIGMDPITMLTEASKNATLFTVTSQTFLPSIISRLAGQHGIWILMASIASLIAVILLLFRKATLPTMFAVCALGSLFWTYCKAYDFPVLSILLVALFVSYDKSRNRFLLYAIISLIALMLLPFRMADHNRLDVQLLFSIVWIASVFILLYNHLQSNEQIPYETVS